MSDTEDRQASLGVGEEAAGSGSREESPALPEPPAMTGNDDDDANNGNAQPQGLVDIVTRLSEHLLSSLARFS